MKILHRSIQLTLVLILVFSSTTIVGKNKVKGTWQYEANGTPPEYSTGEITITKKRKEYTISLFTNNENITATNVKVTNSKVTFQVYVADMNIDIVMNIAGDTMTGKAVSYDSTFPLSGLRI